MFRAVVAKPDRFDCPLASRCRGRCPRGQRDITEMSGIRAAAANFIERFGDGASQEACVRADELLRVGNYEGRARWQLINREILAMLAAVGGGALDAARGPSGKLRPN